ncbi:MAG: hypothetical protein FWC28_09265 [Proteobacteria bacterium]|nr:hypothetical protein [Cystobacterineae bacterium]MCL2258252.1 hypothetical protein [Cystobacterineae bacterium]MCL2315413.1 hypothetical protein [Pseudomonadota bacterium]
MKFEFRHLLSVTLEEMETTLSDERYPPFLLQYHPLLLSIQVLEVLLLNGRLLRRIRYLPKPLIRSIGPKQVDPSWFSFVEYSTYDFETKTLRFSNEPDNAYARAALVNQGQFLFSPLGNQIQRIVNGTLSLHLPKQLRFLAHTGEYLIRQEGLKILQSEIPIMERFSQEVLRPPPPSSSSPKYH